MFRDGQVVSATGNATGFGFFDVPAQLPGADQVVDVARLPHDEGGPFRVTALGTATPQGPTTVVVAVDVEAIHDAVAAFVRDGLLALMLLTLAVGAVSWLVIGRTLAPVDAISRQAGLITAKRLDQRVPEPRARDEIRRPGKDHQRHAHPARAERAAAGTVRRRRGARASDAVGDAPTAPGDRPQPRRPGRRRAASPDLLGETLRLGSLVDELLLLARSDAGRLAAQVEPVDLDEVVTAVVASSQDRRVAVRAAEIEPLQVLGEPALLKQVVRNLVENAVRHARSRVDVALTADSTSAVLTVDDDGPGIPPDARTEVFQRFVRLDDSRTRDQGGVGLGLAIVDEIVKLHAGSVQVTESPAAGARLRVRLRWAEPGQRGTSPRMKASSCARPLSSGICTGGDFIR